MTLLDPPAALFSPTRENFPSHSIPTRYSLHVSKLFQRIRETLFPITSPQGVRAAVSRTTSVCRTNNRGGPALLSIHTLSRTSKSKTYLDHLSIIKIIFLQVESPVEQSLKLYFSSCNPHFAPSIRYKGRFDGRLPKKMDIFLAAYKLA